MPTQFYNSLVKAIGIQQEVQELRKRFTSSNHHVRLANVVPSYDALVLAEIFELAAREVVFVMETATEAERLYDDLVKLLSEESVILFAEAEQHSRMAKALKGDQAISDTSAQMLEALEKITAAQHPLIVVADVSCLSVPLEQPKEFKTETLRIRTKEEAGFELLERWLRDHHFEKKQFVDSCGDYAVRGGIIDVFPFTESVPYRVEFFGDEIESIREFDVISQRSITERRELVLIPNSLAPGDNIRNATLLDYIAEGSIVGIAEPERVSALLEEQGNAEFASLLGQKLNIAFSNFDIPGFETFDLHSKRQPNFQANLKLIRAELDRLTNEHSTIVLTAENKDLKRRLEELVESTDDERENADADVNNAETESIESGKTRFLMPSLSFGFVLPSQNAVVYAEHELFGRRRDKGTASKKRNTRSKGISLRELRSLKRGDLLVHEEKGIGKFMGLDTIEIQGAKQEVVRLQYRDTDTLFVNLDYIGKLSRYSAGDVESGAVELSKLGSSAWQRTRERTKKRLKDIARNLIAIYAKRKKQKGFSFAPDDVIQHEMEAAFLYEDTPDQARATEDVKQDMQSPSPMDRLVCGDVGYGKTEVAMRAAMKATLDKKQVAVLVPTTVLAEQHERSFRDRLERFGVSVASLSRFKTVKEQKEILGRLKEGKVDVLIGTHRILSKDVEFKDLGLLIVDEEHRFGVAAKEKLRELRATVDTLTLTATPIPRTLNFSLLGARDLSVIETPPKNRLPIATEIITELESEPIRNAMRRELDRGGLIYAINDKVNDMELFAAKLRTLAPRARVGIVHGQMPPSSIEKVMRDFLEHKIDVLCATKIVESGLDIPSANTIIINRAHNFGLAELYQLRGRVGRSNEQAYCFLVTIPVKNLSKDSLRRLEAMEEFSELGAGFQLAMRDLEIRGAGNLLGGEQSGFINEIGFELYQKTLSEAVEELKEEEFTELFKDVPTNKGRNPFVRKFSDDVESVTLALGVDALIPEYYIEDDSERFGFYQRFASVSERGDLDELSQELRDRFGPLPEEVRNLAHIASIRVLSVRLGFRRLATDEASRSIRITLPPEEQSDYYREFFPRILDSFKSIGEARVRLLTEGKSLKIMIRLQTLPRTIERLSEIENILSQVLESTAIHATT